jgi:hypothetical protein
MDILNIVGTAFAVFVGTSLAISVLTDSVRRLTKMEADRVDRADKIADRKADQLEQAYQRSLAGYAKDKQIVSAGVDAAPKWNSGNETSKDFNVQWAKHYYDELTTFRRIISRDRYFSWASIPGTGGATDLDFDRIVGTLCEIKLADADLQLCEIGISEDEEMLEWARLREDPRSAAYHLRALRRHNRLHPILKGRREYWIGRLKYELKYWKYFNQLKDEHLADEKAKAECPLSKWNMEEVPSHHHHDYFYLYIWNGCMDY